ncbi:MAG: TIGR01244 family sulfur transferase [Porticoccaceae bacterium]
MKLNNIDDRFSTSDQLSVADIPALAQDGVKLLICNRPDGEAAGQADFATIAGAAQRAGIDAVHIPFVSGELSPQHLDAFSRQLQRGMRTHAYCRTGRRSQEIWRASRAATPAVAHDGGRSSAENHYQIVIVGAGSAGIAVAASLLKRNADLRIALVDPAEEHFYQPGWTLVGGGVFDVAGTRRDMAALIPEGTHWVRKAVAGFEPEHNRIRLDDDSVLYYSHLVVAAGIKLDWDAVEGLSETLGSNGVCSNYRYDLAPYTWQLTQELSRGRALFTQPPQPIKCAGAPQKALYLAADHWLRQGVLNNVDIHFYNAGAVLFGVPDYVPALAAYMGKYRANLHYGHRLTRIDGDSRTAWFACSDENGATHVIEERFDMIHVCPPQCAPDFIRSSTLADGAGWLDVDPVTLRHSRYPNIWGLGDCIGTSNAKTMAAARKQAPIVAHNICDVLAGRHASRGYDGYGACPLTVERGRIVLAEFGYDGKLCPSFPKWLNDGTQATRFAWQLKARILPPLYWHGMLKGREWLTACQSAG